MIGNCYHNSSQAYSFTTVSTDYIVRGELCYNSHGYVARYPVVGEMHASLTSISSREVSFTFSYWLQHATSEQIFEQVSTSGLIVDRIQPDGNVTLLFIDLPCGTPQNFSTLTNNVLAHYQGERYVSVGGKEVKARYFCTAIADLQTVLRFEWYFEWKSGILLQFSKSIEQNLVRVQWLDHKAENTTLSLIGSHPVTALFANIQEWFYGGIGAGIIGVFLFYFLIQKKFEQETTS